MSVEKGNMPGTKLIPTSITTAPGLIHEPFMYSAFPIAATTMSAFLTYVDRMSEISQS